MTTDLKKKSIHGVFWSFIQKFGILFLSFITNIVLVRLLSPEDFGVFGVLLIFISFADIFIDSGFGSALIQRNQVSSVEYSSVFYFNIFVSLIIFFVFYFSSDLVADYFNNDQLSVLLKVQSFVVIFNGLCVVQNNRLQKQLKFKKLAALTTTVAILANILTVILAFNNFGTWSLVFRSLIISFGTFVLLWIFSDWKPKKEFSFASIKSMFSFSFYIFLSSFIEKIYLNIQSFIIGKQFSLNQLGYYSQANRLQELPANAISQVINQVSFPVYAIIKSDKKKLKDVFSKNVTILFYLVIPSFLILFTVAKELVLLLYGKNWIESVFYFKYLCLFGMILPINIMHTNIIKSLGNGKLYFYQQLLKRVIGIILIVFSIQFGIKGVMISTIFTGYIALFINLYITSCNLDYKVTEQFKHIFSSLLPNIIPFSFIYFYKIEFSNLILTIISNVFIYLLLFLIFSKLFKNSSFLFLYNLIKNETNKIFNKSL